MNEPIAPFLILLGVIAVAGIAAGVVLALSGYSSGGAFAVASACVGVLGTLATEHVVARRPPDK
jgi:hypothetical protein